MRTMSEDDAILVVEEGKKFLNKGVVAIDLAGPEEEGFVKKYKKAIEKVLSKVEYYDISKKLLDLKIINGDKI